MIDKAFLLMRKVIFYDSIENYILEVEGEVFMKKIGGILITISVALAIFALVILGIYKWIDSRVRDAKTISSVTTEEYLEKIISNDNYVIVDARSKGEYEKEHVVGAVNIPYSEMDENICNRYGLKKKDVIVYAGDERTSELACEKLIELGYGGLDIGAYEFVTLDKE